MQQLNLNNFNNYLLSEYECLLIPEDNGVSLQVELEAKTKCYEDSAFRDSLPLKFSTVYRPPLAFLVPSALSVISYHRQLPSPRSPSPNKKLISVPNKFVRRTLMNPAWLKCPFLNQLCQKCGIRGRDRDRLWWGLEPTVGRQSCYAQWMSSRNQLDWGGGNLRCQEIRI